MKKTSIKYCLCILFPFLTFAQKIDNTASFRNISSDHYFRFNYDNDFFTSSDEYYTQGFNFEFVSPRLKHNPINSIFLKSGNSSTKFGLSLEHIGFTPTSILSNSILYGDRPFAAAIMLKSFVISTDTIHHLRFVSALNIGIIGPGAFGGDMQTAIHRWTGNPEPQGWQYQIKNDLVLNYEMAVEKQLLRLGNVFSLQSNAAVKLGTLFTNASAGFNATFGILNAPFASADKNRFALYLYSQPVVNIIGYDATLQGGLFNRKSPYTIANGDIKRVTAQNNYGIVLQYRSLYVEYSRNILTREFETGKSNKWGGFKIGFKL